MACSLITDTKYRQRMEVFNVMTGLGAIWIYSYRDTLEAAALSYSFRTVQHVNTNSTAPELQQKAKNGFVLTILCLTKGKQENRGSNCLTCLLESPDNTFSKTFVFLSRKR